MKIKTENNIINKFHNSNFFKTKLLTKNFIYYPTLKTNTNQTTKNTNDSNENSKNKIRKPKVKIKDNKGKKDINNLNNYLSNSIKKKKLLLNNKPNSCSFFINVKQKNSRKKLLLKPISIPFKQIKYLNIKKIRIKEEIKPLLNNNFKNELLKNKTSFLQLNDKKVNFVKSKSLFNFKVRNLKLNKNFTSCNINFFKDYEKDFFPGLDYSHLEYNEKEIYMNKAEYDNLIKEKIDYFKNNINENKTIKLDKIFKYGKNKKDIDLTLNSLIITWEEMGLPSELQNKKLKITFPFSLLPIFYYKGSDSFQKLLAAVIKIGDHFEKVFFDDDKISIALNNIKDYQNNISLNDEISKDDEYNENSFISKTSKKPENKPISLRPLILQKSRDFLRFNNFIFFWITNTRNFATKVTLPCVTLKIVENNIVINQYLDYEFLFFLYKKNFVNWEYYIVRYLSTYSKFRIIFQELGSHIKINNKTIYLKEPKVKINTFAEEALFNIYTDQFYKNSIILFKSFYITINFNHNYIYEKNYNIYFSFLQYIKLYEIAKYSPKIDFIIKFLEINNDTHTLDFNYKEYDAFDIKTWMDNIKKYSEKSLEKEHHIEENLYGDYDIYTKNIKIDFKKPQWTIIKFINDEEISKTWEIGKELEVDLVKSILYSNTESWTNLLNGCLKKLDEPVPVVHSIPVKRKTYKRGKIRNTGYSSSSSKSSKDTKKSKFN